MTAETNPRDRAAAPPMGYVSLTTRRAMYLSRLEGIIINLNKTL